MKNATFNSLTTFLNELEQESISYTLAHNRDESMMVFIAMPGERWEIEFLSDGSQPFKGAPPEVTGEVAAHRAV